MIFQMEDLWTAARAFDAHAGKKDAVDILNGVDHDTAKLQTVEILGFDVVILCWIFGIWRSIESPFSLDWLKGKSTGNHGFPHQI